MSRRILPLILLCAGASLSTPAFADNFCLDQAGDPQLSFPGTNKPYVFAVTGDSSSGYGLSLCSPTGLDISWITSYSFGDFNHDGWEDVMFGRAGTDSGAVKLFLNDKTGSGTVVLSTTLSTGAGAAPTAVDALDLNGDGWDDIVTGNGTDGTFSILLNDGTGEFPSVQQYATGSDVALLVATDMNGDHHPDVITASAQDQTVSVSFDNGDGTFAAPVAYSVGAQLIYITITDINGDGHPDMSLASSLGSLQMLNKGDGTFTVSAWQPHSSGPGSSPGSGGSGSSSGVDITARVTNLSDLFGTAGSQSSDPQAPSVAVISGTGQVTLSTTSSTTVVSGSTASGSSGNSSASSPQGSSGGGALGWLSLMLLGVAGLLRRKRA